VSNRVLLVTGFGPFPGVPRNPAERTARAIAADGGLRRIGLTTHCAIFHTSYAALEGEAGPLLAQVQPAAILMIGVASRRRHLSVELNARNRRALLFPDAAGQRSARLAINPSMAFLSKGRAPFAACLRAGHAAGLDTRLSTSAGTYLCNYSYWLMLEATDARIPCLFLHIPKLRGPWHFQRLVRAGVAMARLLVQDARWRSNR